MERRMRGNSHVRCGVGENPEIISKGYLSLLLDAIGDARKAEVETPAELDVRLHDAGAALSRAKSALTKTKRAKEKMEMLSATLAKFQSSREIAEQILNMEEGPEKEELKKKHADILEEYRSSKAVLYRYNMTTDEQIKDFELRFAKIDQDIVDLEARLDRAKEEYRKLKKIEHSVTLAQNTQYCYGPTYGKEVPGGGGRGEEASLDGVENSERKAKT